MKKIALVVLFLSILLSDSQGQYVFRTFKETHIINTQSIETLRKQRLALRIGHRFGDIAGTNGGWETFYGFESIQDVLIGFEYGISDRLMVGIGRTKGAGLLKRNISGTLKYRALQQTEEKGMPLSLTLLGIATASTMKKSDNVEALNSFPKAAHRWAYCGQLLLARKFSDAFSLQVIPSYCHRNLVPVNDENGIFSLGVATRVQLSKTFGIIADATYPFSELRTGSLKPAGYNYYIPMGIGLEIDTGGHIFQVNFTNAQGIMETDYIPYSDGNWADGEFRLGFTITRIFAVGKE